MSPSPVNGAFGKLLRERRGDLSQRVVEERIDAQPSYISKLESGAIRPPGLAKCEEIARAIEPDSEQAAALARLLWDYAAPERLNGFDPDLYDWHEDQRDAQLSESEWRLVRAARAVNSYAPGSGIAGLTAVLERSTGHTAANNDPRFHEKRLRAIEAVLRNPGNDPEMTADLVARWRDTDPRSLLIQRETLFQEFVGLLATFEHADLPAVVGDLIQVLMRRAPRPPLTLAPKED